MIKRLTIILIFLLFWALHKWIIYRLSVQAILLYYAELGAELPDAATIQKYRIKAAMKSLHIKEGQNGSL